MSDVDVLVDRAVKAAVPPDGMAEYKIRPESEITWTTPTPLAGLRAAQQVAQAAMRQAYRYALALRGEGQTWDQVADLLGIEWSSEHVRRERAFELILGPDPEGSRYRPRNLYWDCAGPGGCGQFITDRGPYDRRPDDIESGHADGCARHAADMAEYERQQDAAEERDRVMEEATPQVEGDFAVGTVHRARHVQTHGGRYLPWSTSETLAVALVLHDDPALATTGYPTREAALARVLSGMRQPPADPQAWLALLRAAATGLVD